MIYQELMEDQFYRYLVNDGVRKGVKKMQETVIGMVAESSAKLESLARTKITAISSLDRLQQLMLDLTILHSHEDMEQFLLSLDEHQSDESTTN